MKRRPKKTPTETDNGETKTKESTMTDNGTTITAPTAATCGSDSEDDDEARTDYNNPAKSTEQNDRRTVQGGPMVGKPSKIDFARYQKHVAGAPVDVVERTQLNWED